MPKSEWVDHLEENPARSGRRTARHRAGKRTHTFACTALSVLGTLGACGPVVGGEGSESHFLCERPSDCDHLGKGYVCEDHLCTQQPDGGASADQPGAASPDSARQLFAEPGVCFGDSINCGPIEYAELEPGPVVEGCDPFPDEVLSLNPEWIAPLGTVGCAEPTCVQFAADMLPASDGRLWISTGVFTPSAEAVLGYRQVGTSLVRLGANGIADLDPAPDLWSAVGGSLMQAQGMLTSDRQLFRAAASNRGTGVELQRRDMAGEPRAATSWIEGTDNAIAAWGNDGSSVVLYSYVLEPAPEPWQSPSRLVNVARFDANGGLLWNQTALEWVGTEPFFRSSSVSSASLDADGNAVLVFGVSAPSIEGTPGGLRIVKLGLDGNTRWARRTPTAFYNRATHALRDGRILVGGSEYFGPADRIPFYIDELDSNGRPIQRRAFPRMDSDGAATVDGARMVQFLLSPDPHVMRFRRIDLDSDGCVHFDVKFDWCFDGEVCPAPPLFSIAGEKLYFASNRLIGSMKLP